MTLGCVVQHSVKFRQQWSPRVGWTGGGPLQWCHMRTRLEVKVFSLRVIASRFRVSRKAKLNIITLTILDSVALCLLYIFWGLRCLWGHGFVLNHKGPALLGTLAGLWSRAQGVIWRWIAPAYLLHGRLTQIERVMLKSFITLWCGVHWRLCSQTSL